MIRLLWNIIQSIYYSYRAFRREQMIRWAVRQPEMQRLIYHREYDPEGDDERYALNRGYFYFTFFVDSVYKSLHPSSPPFMTLGGNRQLAFREEVFFAQAELEGWCCKNCEHDWFYFYDDQKYTYFFRSKEDAIYFKLRWDGEYDFLES